MRTVILVPRRSDNGHRDALWDWCKTRWQAILPDARIYEGHHNEGPFNRSAAINLAARLADQDGRWDVALVIDADIFIRRSQVRAAIKTAAKGRVTWAHRRWRGLHQDHTARVVNPKLEMDFGPEIDRDDMDVLVERTNPYSWSCCVAIPRSVFDDLGGFDERFVGWGYEDMAAKSVIQGLYDWSRIDGDVFHLWHPRSEERIVKGQPAETASPEYLTNARLGRRYMIAQYRDYGFGDEGERLPGELRERHVKNLQRDDGKLNLAASRYGLPDWSEWWPPLAELRDGAKAYRADLAQPKVTLIVHTGGTPEAWPDRREYLRRSLASLTEQVSGPIVQRVIYSDWGSDLLPELGLIAARHGFYVAGDGHHGYTGSMQAMWRYLAKRAKGEYIFMAEDDFTYQRPVDLLPMIEALLANPHLVQMALLRDAFYQDEQETGGILGWPEPAFSRQAEWLEHKLFFTANPSLFRRSLTATPWPSGHHSETLFGRIVLADKDARAAFWGQGEEWVKHIGQVRAGVAY